MADKDGNRTPRAPRPEDIEDVLGFVPLIEAYFRRCQAEMPDALLEVFTAHRLTARHGGVLAQLSAGQSISVTDLAKRMGISLSTASELVGDLARAELVERREDPTNRRRTLVNLDETHRAAFEAFVAQRAAPLLKVLTSLPHRDRQGFARGLSAWAHEVRNW